MACSQLACQAVTKRVEWIIAGDHCDMIEQLIKQAKTYLPRFDEKRLRQAFEFAAKAHEGQFRKAGEPYITHPVSAAEILTRLRVDEDTLIACLLHDVPEDTSCTIAEIEELFGKKVAFLVEGITKLSKVYYRHNMEGRQVESLKKLFLHSAQDPRTILIKLADRLHNMMTISALPREKQERIARETLEIFVPIANLLGIWGLKDELEDCCFKTLCPEEYAEIDALIQNSKVKKSNLLTKSIAAVQEILDDKVKCTRIEGRQKTHYRVFKKMTKQHKSFKEIYDLIGLRIIVDDVVDCYQVLGILHQHFRPKIGRLKDYIGNPKSNGYQSLHTTVFGLEGMLTEIQVRTEDMHLENEYGIAAHYFYREGQKQKKALMESKIEKKYQWVQRILEMQRNARSNEQFLENLKLDVFEDRIFVFTPNGDVVDLPRGSNVIDFAYQIHTELAEKAVSAQVNGRSKKIEHTLKNGDVIHIECSPEAAGPHLSWHYLCKTNHARIKIRQYLRGLPTRQLCTGAEDVLDQKLKLFGLPGLQALSPEQKELLMQHFFVHTWKEFLTCVGKASIDVREAIGLLFTQEELYGNATDPLNAAAYEREAAGIKVYHIHLMVEMKNRVGILRDICSTLAEQTVNILKVESMIREHPDKARVRFVLEIQDTKHYQRMISAINGLEDVFTIERLQSVPLEFSSLDDAHKMPVQ